MENKSSPTKLVSECYIKPVYSPEESKEPYHLPPAEISFLSCHPIQKGLLYTKPGSFELDQFLNEFKRSLSIALVYFYPLAGRFVEVTCPEDQTCWVYLDCNKGPGVRFINSVCDSVTVQDVVLNEPGLVPVIRSFFEMGEEDIVNVSGCTRALLSVQVTELKDGVFIGFTMNHSVADGSSFWHFVNTLSEIFESINTTSNAIDNDQITNIKVSRPPIFKPVFPDGCGSVIKLPHPNINEFAGQFPITKVSSIILTERIFHLSPSSIAKLKAQANTESCCDVKTSDHISSFQAVCALLWRCITRARHLGSDDTTVIMIVASSRTRINPPLPVNHFGNMILPIDKTYKVSGLLENGLGFAAKSLHETIAAVDDKACRGFSRMMVDHMVGIKKVDMPSWAVARSPTVVGGSARFDNFGPEFGLGKAVALRTGYAAKTDGKVTVSQGREGGGSMDLEISLSSEVMSDLEKDEEFMSFVSFNKY